MLAQDTIVINYEEGSVCSELEVILTQLGAFEDHVRTTRKDFLRRISECLLQHNLFPIPTDSDIYQSIFLVYVKCVRNHICFVSEENQKRFKSIFNMELQYHDMILESNHAIQLRNSKNSK